jgi:hypothetical protein
MTDALMRQHEGSSSRTVHVSARVRALQDAGLFRAEPDEHDTPAGHPPASSTPPGV